MRTGVSSRRTMRQRAASAVRSSKIKELLLCLGITFMFCFVAGFTTSVMGWKCHDDPLPRSSVGSKRYTLLVNTWRRHDLLKRSVSHYASCSGVDSIHIIWSEPDLPSEHLINFLMSVIELNSKDGRQIELKFDVNEEDSLNNRFKELKDLKSDAILSMDDDIIIPCRTVDFAFNVWESTPDTMVGFVPRVHWVDKSGKYIYGGWWSVWWTGTYSMILTKAAFIHKKYLSIYTIEMPASIREYVTKKRNCEDIAMSFLVANATDSPPVWVKGALSEIGSTGISSLGGHKAKRGECINWFVNEYGRMPLVSTTMKVVDSRFSWFW